MELRFLFFSVLVVCGTMISTPARAQAPEFTETEEIIEVETPAESETTEVMFPETGDLPDVAIPEPEELPLIPATGEFIPDESLMMDTLPPLDEFPEFDGGFDIPSFSSELDPARVIRERIQIRRARMKLASDPEFQAMRADAEATGTAYEYREKMQEYYTALYDGVQKAHPGLEKAIEAERMQFLGGVMTGGIRPTERPSHLPPLPPGSEPAAPEPAPAAESLEPAPANAD